MKNIEIPEPHAAAIMDMLDRMPKEHYSSLLSIAHLAYKMGHLSKEIKEFGSEGCFSIDQLKEDLKIYPLYPVLKHRLLDMVDHAYMLPLEDGLMEPVPKKPEPGQDVWPPEGLNTPF